jgi:hypothetical protein
MKPLVFAMLLCASVAIAETADPMKELASIHDFAFGGIGYAGTTSRGELAFREILRRPSTEKDFIDLLASGNAQACCYALVALHSLNPKTYADRVRQFEHDQTEVSLIGGGIVTVEPMSSVVVNIGSGRYDSYLKRRWRRANESSVLGIGR